MRSDSVSMPCMIKNAFIGAIAAPMLRSGTTRARAMKAAGPKASVITVPW